MPKREELYQASDVADTGGSTFGTVVASNTRRYVYQIATENRFAGANVLQFGYDIGGVQTILDHIAHATQWEMWRDPDTPTEDSLPIYIIPAGATPYAITDNGDCWVRILYADGP